MVDYSAEMIKSILKKHAHELREKYGVQEIGVFGSYVRGEQREGSDIDILVEFDKNTKMDLIRFVELEEYLSHLLSAKVDLVLKSSLRQRVAEHILKEVVYI